MILPKLRPTFTFDQERLDALKAIAPEAFADGKLNWEVLKDALGEHLEDEGRDAEHFGLFWPGKRAARRLASTPSVGTLRPAPGEGVNEATTRHLFIEGDNLEVLKLLQKSYAGRVKMIYIDPPYNTGNDFIYSDNFTQPLDEYLRATGQADEMGRVLVTNRQAGGRYHSNWLNMMYPRLRLARNLLRDDGVIFVSIDDNEVHNLRALMNEMFGEENFVTTIVWQKKYAASSDDQGVANMHEYLLGFSRSSSFDRGLFPRTETQYARYGNLDNDPRGDWASDNYLSNKSKDQRPTLYYPILHPKTRQEVWPPEHAVWRYSRSKHELMVLENRLYWGPDLSYARPRLKRFRHELKPGVVPSTWWPHTDAGHNDEAKKQLALLMDDPSTFPTPKPVRLLKRLFLIGAIEEDSIILDFFAGSCTTAHAILELNHEDGGDRRSIMVQFPEPTGKADYATIADIGKERIRRVIRRLQAENAGQLSLAERETPEDLGFRVFKLDRSHFKAWRDFDGGDLAGLQARFDAFESPLVEGWQMQDLLVEVLLMEGFPLDSTVSPASEFTHNAVQVVASDLVAHRLFVCLDAAIADATIAALQMGPDDLFICLDAALSDGAKVRLEDGRRVKVI